MNLTPIVLYNISSATPASFQQMLTIPSSSLINSTYTNIRFRDGNYNLLVSWLESYTVSSAVFWILLPNGIAADSAMTVYMETGNLSDNFLDGITVGEAPQLSATYGQYDNGAIVFTNYWNFAGTSLPSGWINNGGVTATVNNGLTLSYGSAPAAANWSSVGITYQNLNLHGSDSVVENLISFSSIVNNTRGILFIESNATDAYSIAFTTYAAVLSNPTNYAAYQPTADSGALGAGTQQFSAGVYAIAGVVNIASTNKIVFTYNYDSETSTLQAESVTAYYLAIGFGESSDPSVSVTWLRVRAYPPNNVMPIQINRLSSVVKILPDGVAI